MPFVADLAANKLEATWKRGFRWRPAYLAIRPGRELRHRPRPSAHSPPLPALRWTTRLPLRHEPSGACNVAQFVAVGGHGRRSSGARCAARCGASPWTHWLDPSLVALLGRGLPCMRFRWSGGAPVRAFALWIPVRRPCAGPPPTCSCCRARVGLPRAGCRQPAPVGRAVLACRALPCVPVPQVSVASSNSEVTAVDSPPPVRRCG